LFKSSTNILKIFDTSDGAVFQITKEKTLMRHYDSMAVVHEKGWEILAEKLAFVHGDLEIGLMQNGEYMLLMYNPNNKQVTLLNITTGNQTSVLFENYAAWNAQNFVFEDDTFRHVNHHGAWLIDAKGNITKADKNSRNASIERVKKLTTLRIKYNTTRSVFKNLHEVFINQGDALVFNTHELHITNNNHFKLEQRRLLKQIMAEKITDNVFQFSDGSQITVHKSGMLILKSSNPDIETVFVSSVLDNTLGVATESVFSGNTYYYKDSKFDLVLEGVGNNELEVLRFICDAKNITRPEAVEIIDNLPYTLYRSISRNIGLSLRNTLVSKGASAKLTPTADIKQLQMESRRFYDTYILPFIKHIKSQNS
jgi:MoxR-vWA-beta-propeller ternary system domain bpX1